MEARKFDRLQKDADALLNTSQALEAIEVKLISVLKTGGPPGCDLNQDTWLDIILTQAECMRIIALEDMAGPELVCDWINQILMASGRFGEIKAARTSAVQELGHA